jgi:PIN domain nuclease of toxin-antitoxin system
MTRPILLDTNVLIWALSDDRALTRRMRAVISATTASVHLSVVSA